MVEIWQHLTALARVCTPTYTSMHTPYEHSLILSTPTFTPTHTHSWKSPLPLEQFSQDREHSSTFRTSLERRYDPSSSPPRSSSVRRCLACYNITYICTLYQTCVTYWFLVLACINFLICLHCQSNTLLTASDMSLAAKPTWTSKARAEEFLHSMKSAENLKILAEWWVTAVWLCC